MNAWNRTANRTPEYPFKCHAGHGSPLHFDGATCSAPQGTARVSHGYTLVEVMLATFLSGAVLAMAVMGFAQSQHTSRITAQHGELEVDARRLVQQLRDALWLTSRDEILLHPEGPGPYTAISFPVGKHVDANGNEHWASTFIYHLWEGDQFQVRRTAFTPRDSTLSGAQRRTQLEDVVNNGSGAGTFNAANAATTPLIRNLVEWELDIVAGQFDAFAPTGGERKRVSIGSALIEPGSGREITFETVGKNPGNTGAARHLGIDRLYLTPSARPEFSDLELEVALEAEALLPAFAHSGAMPTFENMTPANETWSGNAVLRFPSNADGDWFTLQFENDQWVERNFIGTSVLQANIERDPLTESGSPSTYALRLEGSGEVWRAAAQTLDTAPSVVFPSNMAVRVLLRGDDILNTGWTNGFDGGWLDFNGTNVWATFSAGWLLSGTVSDVFIAQSADPGNATLAMDYVPGTDVSLTFNGGNGSATFTSQIETDPARFLIERTNSYLVGFRINPSGDLFSTTRRWTCTQTGIPPSSYVLVGATAGETRANDWSAHASIVETNVVYGLRSLRAGHAPQGSYTSKIIDTRVDNNQDYLEFRWNAAVPETSGLTMLIRAGNDPLLAGAPDWTNIAPSVSGQMPAIQGRYAQVQAQFEVGEPAAGWNGTTFTPLLRDFTLRWEGESRMVNLYLDISTGPNHGIYEARIDDLPLLQGVTVKATVYKDINLGGQTKRLTAKTFAEIQPRNTGVDEQ